MDFYTIWALFKLHMVHGLKSKCTEGQVCGLCPVELLLLLSPNPIYHQQVLSAVYELMH